MKYIKRNNIAIESGKQRIDKIQREMERKVRELIFTLQQQIENIVHNIHLKMESAENQIENESQSMYEALRECQRLKQQIKRNINKPVQSWTQLKQRSSKILQDSQSTSITSSIDQDTFKSVENIQISNDIQWEHIIHDFTHHIKNNINIVVRFDNISIDDNEPNMNTIKQVSPKQTTLVTQPEIEDIDNDEPVIEDKQDVEDTVIMDQNKDDIKARIICFTREGNIHCCNLNVNIQDKITINDAVWSFARMLYTYIYLFLFCMQLVNGCFVFHCSE